MTMKSTDYALLSENAYLNPVLEKDIEMGGVTYKAIDFVDNPATGFQATAYRRKDTNELVIAFRGTEFGREPVHDGGVDAGMVLAGVNAQAPDALAFTKRVLERERVDADLNHRPVQVTVTGHSLGGTLAEIVAAKNGLHGETFNAYGAAGLREGVPKGGSQVIDHVRAGDVVSAASPHFGEVRTYAAQKDVDTLTHAGYRDDSSILSPRNPIKAIDFGAHSIDNFIPNSQLLGQSIISEESQARYRAHEGMIDRYRNDVMDIRLGLSASWEIPKAIGEFKDAVEHRVGEAVSSGIRSVEHGIEHVKEGARELGHAASEGFHKVEEKASHTWQTLTHPGSWFEHDKPEVKLDHPAHPDHALFKQAQSAVHQLDRDHGRVPDMTSDQISGAATVQARRDGLSRIDSAALSDDKATVYVVQGSLDLPLKRVAELPTAQAASTTIDQSSQQWQQVAQQAQQAQQLAQQQTPQSPTLQQPPDRPATSPGL